MLICNDLILQLLLCWEPRSSNQTLAGCLILVIALKACCEVIELLRKANAPAQLDVYRSKQPQKEICIFKAESC